MPISVECDICGKGYHVRDERAGTVIRCKECGSDIDVPDDEFGNAYGGLHAAPRRGQKPPRPTRTESQGLPPAVWAGVGGVAVLIIVGGILFAVSGSGDQPDASVEAKPADGETAEAAAFDSDAPDAPVGQLPAEAQGGADSTSAGTANTPSSTPDTTSLAAATPESQMQPLTSESEFAPAEPIVWNVVVDPASADDDVAAAGSDGDGQPPQDDTQVKQGSLQVGIPGRMPYLYGVHYPLASSDFVVVGSDDQHEIWNLRSREKVSEIQGRVDGASCTISPDGSYFAAKASGFEQKIVVWDSRANKALGSLPLPQNQQLRSLEFAGKRRLCAIPIHGPMTVWKLPSGDRERTVEFPRAWKFESLTFSPGGRYAVYTKTEFGGTSQDQLIAVDLDTGETAAKLKLPQQVGALNCYGLTFSDDATELAGVFREDVTHLLCWDWKDGETLVHHTLGSRVHDTVPGAGKYTGRAIEWFPDKQRWLLYGHAVVDREAGGPIWNVPEDTTMSRIHPRRILDSNRLALTQGDQQKFVAVFEFPSEEIERAAEVIAAGGTARDVHLPPFTKSNWDTARILALSGDAWRAQVGPTPTQSLAQVTAPVALESQGPIRSAVLAPAAPAVVLSTSADKNGESAIKLEKFALPAAGTVATTTVPFAAELMAVAPTGTRALVRTADDRERLDVYNLDDGTHVAGWRPYWKVGVEMGSPSVEAARRKAELSRKALEASREMLKAQRRFGSQSEEYLQAKQKFERMQSQAEQSVEQAVFVDEEHVLTVSRNGQLVLWRFPECRAEYVTANAFDAALSPDRRYVAFVADGKVHVVDALSGEQHGLLPVEGVVTALAFHPDGERLAAISRDGIETSLIVWKTSDGRKATEFPIPVAGDDLQWCGTENLLIDRQRLVNLPGEVLAWTYELASGTPVLNVVDDRHWYVAGTGPVQLVATRLPHSAVEQQLDSIDRQTIVHPGARIALQVRCPNPPGHPGLAQELPGRLEKQLSEHDVTVDDNAPVQLQVGVDEKSTGRSVEYRSIGGFGRGAGGTTSVSVREIEIQMAIVRSGQPLWTHELKFANTEFFTRRTEEASLQEHLDKRMWQKATDYLSGFQLPKYVFLEGAAEGAGTSTLGPAGVR